jgi:hypothetical protein
LAAPPCGEVPVCDTAAVRQLSRGLSRWDPLRVACVGFGLATVLVLASYVVSVVTSQLKVGGAVSALSLLAVAGAGLLYAWRLRAGVVE